ncbi:MAG: ABC transporter substrate-binding protein [Thermodesulfobacteriota bacterium]
MRKGNGFILCAFLVVTLILGFSHFGSGSAQAQTGGPVKLGFASPLSPPGDVEGGQINLNTVKLAVKEINDRGGIKGRQVEIVVGDDEGTPGKGASVVEKLITDDKVSAIVGVWHSSVAMAQAKVATENKVPLMVHYSFTDDLTTAHSDYVFRVGPFNSNIAVKLAPYMKAKGYKNVALVSEDTAWGIGFAKVFKTELDKLGVPSVTRIYPAQTLDVNPLLLEIKALAPKPDVMVLCAAYQAAYLIPKTARELGLTPGMEIIEGYDLPGWAPDWWKITGEAGVGVMYPTFYAKGLTLSPAGEKFREAFQKAYQQAPPIYSYFLYDVVMMLGQVIEKEGSDPKAIAAGLKKITYPGTTGSIKFESHPEPGPVWNCWLGQQMFLVKLAKVGQKGEDAEVVHAWASK